MSYGKYFKSEFHAFHRFPEEYLKSLENKSNSLEPPILAFSSV